LSFPNANIPRKEKKHTTNYYKIRYIFLVVHYCGYGVFGLL
jgi:hypothetical protein